MNAFIYIARHERLEAIEAYGQYLTETQKKAVRENEEDLNLVINYDKRTSTVLFIKHEG